MKAEVLLRRFDAASAADYAALAGLRRTVIPEYARSEEELRDTDRRCSEMTEPWMRWFASDEGGDVIGMAEFTPSRWQPGPGKYFLALQVHPDHQGTGIGKALYNTLWAELEKHNPTCVKSEWREDMARAMRFLTERGFGEVARYYESRLDIKGFDLSPFAEDYYKPLSHGIVFRTWRELKASDSNADHKMWRACVEISHDVPSDVPFVELPFDRFQALVMTRPNLDPDGYFVAVDETTGEYAGISHIWRRQADNDLDTGLTGVKRSYRRRGIALALKLRIVRWAKENGFDSIRTENDVTNRPMLSINERLGFYKLPPWLELVWRPEPG